MEAVTAPPAPPINLPAATKGDAQDNASTPSCSVDEDNLSDLDFDLDSDLGSKVWVDDIERFETNVLQAVGYDRKLAARLIPQLYVALREERSAAVGSWKANFHQCAGDPGSSQQSSPPTQKTSGETSSGNNKKRQACHDCE